MDKLQNLKLRLIGMEYPRVHEVGDVLADVKEDFPGWFRKIKGFSVQFWPIYTSGRCA